MSDLDRELRALGGVATPAGRVMLAAADELAACRLREADLVAARAKDKERIRQLEDVVIAAYEDDCSVGRLAGALDVLPGLETYLKHDDCDCLDAREHIDTRCHGTE